MSEERTIRTLSREAREALSEVSDTPSLDSQLLLMRTLGRPRSWLLAHPEFKLTRQETKTYRDFVERCAGGEALPYVLGWWEFYGRQFHLTKDVLIPRPESEHLVEVALNSLATREQEARVLEVGAGSGCVIITLALELPSHDYWAGELSWPALQVTAKNRWEYRLEELQLVQADLLGPFKGQFDVIVANLPYLRKEALLELDVAKREPTLALDGGPDGLDPLRRLADDLPRSLAPGGELLLELDPDQMEPAEEILRHVLSWRSIQLHTDLAGRARVLQAEAKKDQEAI